MEEALATEIRDAIAQVRSAPAHFASSNLGIRMTHFDEQGRYLNPKRRGAPAPLVTKDGAKGVRNAMKKLLKLEPLTGEEAEFSASAVPGLDLSAEDQLEELANAGGSGSSAEPDAPMPFADRMNMYGTWAGSCGQIVWQGEVGEEAGVDGLEIVSSLIIDDGSRKHKNRKMLLNPKFRCAGVAVAKRRGSGNQHIVVIQLATSFEGDDEKVKKRKKLGAAGYVRAQKKAARQAARASRGGEGERGEGAGSNATSPGANGSCPKCGVTIRGRNIVTALDRNWHGKCFSCDFCETTLVGVQFITEPHPAGVEKPLPQIMCQPCWQQKFGKHCHICSEFIPPGVNYRILQTEPPKYEHEGCADHLKAQKSAARVAARGERRSRRTR